MNGPHCSGRGSEFVEHRERWAQRVGAFCTLPALIRQLGGDVETELGRAGLAADALDDAEGRVPFDALVELLHAAARSTGCAHLGLLAGRMWRLQDLGAVGALMRHSHTVREALQSLTVHQHLNSDGGLAFLIERDGTVDVGYAIYRPGVVHADQLHDLVLAIAFNFMRELCGPGWLPSEVLLPHARPADTGPWRRFFKTAPRFNAEVCALRFASGWMDRAIAGSDAAIRRSMLQKVARSDDDALIPAVFRALRLVLVNGRSSGDDVAAALSMHRRTLNRRLRARGTTFQRVLDQVRLDVARQLLHDSDIALDDIAAALGYAGVSPFMRTFRRWTGTTPGRCRRGAIPVESQDAAAGLSPMVA